MTVPHPSRPVRLAAAAAIAGLALGGCSMFSPQTTTNVTYAPSDGVQGEVGPVAVRNLMVLTAEQGAEAELVGALFNSSQRRHLDRHRRRVRRREPDHRPRAGPRASRSAPRPTSR